jgi:hypothetical protein
MRAFIGCLNALPLLVALGLVGVVSGVDARPRILSYTKLLQSQQVVIQPFICFPASISSYP